MHIRLFLLSLLISLTSCGKPHYKVLIVDGQNNHAVWPKSTLMMKQYLEETGIFDVDIYRSKFTWKGKPQQAFLEKANIPNTTDLEKPKTDPDFNPDFKKYDVVISNFGWRAAPWPEKTQKNFEAYMKNGGGFVSVHAADNSFPKWPAYNQMIGLGGWGNRNSKSGFHLYYDDNGKLVKDVPTRGCGAHGAQHELLVTMRDLEHPITKGIPSQWLTTKNECYSHLCGPAENATILATAKDRSAGAKSDKNEPILLALDFGKGRIFHTTLGHGAISFEGVGFISTLLRGTEWAASGKVTIPLPKDFPTVNNSSKRTFTLKEAQQ